MSRETSGNKTPDPAEDPRLMPKAFDIALAATRSESLGEADRLRLAQALSQKAIEDMRYTSSLIDKDSSMDASIDQSAESITASRQLLAAADNLQRLDSSKAYPYIDDQATIQAVRIVSLNRPWLLHRYDPGATEDLIGSWAKAKLKSHKVIPIIAYQSWN